MGRDRRHEVGGASGDAVGKREIGPGAVLAADAVHERGRELAGVLVRELVVDAEVERTDVEHAAAHHEGRAEELLASVAGVRVDHLGVGAVDAERVEDRRGACVRVHAVEAHVHVPEVVDLVLGDGAVVRDGQ